MSSDKELKSRREILKKSAYVVPAVFTMAIAPGISTSVYAQDCGGKGKGKGKGGCAAPVSEPSTVGMFGLGLAGIAATRLLKKSRSKTSDPEKSDSDK